MERDLDVSENGRLVYRQGPHRLFGLSMTFLGLAAVCGTGGELLRQWPIVAAALLGGLIVSAAILGFGMSALICRRVIVSRAEQRIIRSSTLLFWRRSTVQPLSHLTSVSWKPLWEADTIMYVVQLLARETRVLLFTVRYMDDARRITREIGEFLDLKQEHWDEPLLQRKGERERPRLLRAGAITRVIRTLAGRQAMRRVLRSDSKLVYAQSFETLLKAFGLLGGLLGLVFLLSPWLGIKVHGLGDAPWAPPLLGGFFVLLAAMFLLGRRGVTLDKQEGFACTWWGFPFPIWIAKRDLATFSAVGLEKALEEGSGQPYIVSRVYLVGDSGGKFKLFSCVDSEAMVARAEETAAFLGCSVVSTSPNQSPNPTWNRPSS